MDIWRNISAFIIIIIDSASVVLVDYFQKYIFLCQVVDAIGLSLVLICRKYHECRGFFRSQILTMYENVKNARPNLSTTVPVPRHKNDKNRKRFRMADASPTVPDRLGFSPQMRTWLLPD